VLFFRGTHQLMSQGELVLGVDLGTTTVKVVAIRASDETLVGSWSCETDASVSSDAGHLASEQDVAKIISAVDTCLKSIPSNLAGVVSKIGISGQMHGLVMWTRLAQSTDEDISPSSLFEDLSGRFMRLSNLYTWQDGRCGQEFLSSLPATESHLRFATGFGCCTLFWLVRHEPGSVEQYRCAGTVQDLLATMLCGLERPLMSTQNAASWGYFDTMAGSWNSEL